MRHETPAHERSGSKIGGNDIIRFVGAAPHQLQSQIERETRQIGCQAALAREEQLAAVSEIGQRTSGDAIGVLPSAAVSRAVGHHAVLIAFPILTIAIVLGSVWANVAWRSYWSNDPKELAAAATWLVFGAYLHVAGRRDRWERLAPWLIVLGFIGVLFTYIGAGLFLVGEHSYGAP